MSIYIKRIERSQINDLIVHLKLLQKQEQANPKTSRKRAIVKIRAKINGTETKTTIQRINEIKTWFFEKINNINTSPVKPDKNEERKKTKSVKSET
jgi:hypothetical protein